MKLSKPTESKHFAGTAYQVVGAGEPVVLIHGVGMDQRAWAPQIEALSAHYRVVTYDMLGHGESAVPADDVSLSDFAEQLLGLLDHLDIPAANIVGHSMGALVAMEFALNYPNRTQSMLALNAVFKRSDEQRTAVLERAAALKRHGVEATVDATLARWFGDPIPNHLREIATLASDILSDVNALGYARAYHLFATSDAAHAHRLADMALPALFMTGELDPNSSPAMSVAMADMVPNAQSCIISDARHMMNWTDADRVNEQLLQFLQSSRR
jgi:pimeloyl-ACP methyl ester carboxylesterase